MRHGPAEDVSASGSDAERDLTPNGRERVRGIAKYLHASGEAPLTIVSSTLLRAVQTAEVMAANLDVGAPMTLSTRRELAPAGNPLTLLAELREQKRRRVMLVGHEPDLSTFARTLLGRPLTRGFMKGMVMGLTVVDEPTVENVWGTKFRFLLDPKMLSYERELL
jgi:phosphohistidine phosphatase